MIFGSFVTNILYIANMAKKKIILFYFIFALNNQLMEIERMIKREENIDEMYRCRHK